MSIDGIRQEWLRQSEKMSADVMRRYHEQRVGSGGREGLGIYGIYQERIAKKKVQIAVKLLRKHGHDITISNISKVTKQSRSTISYYMPAHILEAHEREEPNSLPKHLAKVIPLRRNP
jgi:hypothetical protein